MFRSGSSFYKLNSNAWKFTKFLSVANCDGDEKASTSSTNLVEQVDKANRIFINTTANLDFLTAHTKTIAEENSKIKTPMQFDNLKYVVQQSSMDAYDGFRLIVQKQVNMNAVAVHT